MENLFAGSETHFKALLIFGGVFALSLIILFIARKAAFRAFYNWARKTDTRIDDVVLDSIRHPSVYWVIAVSLYIALDTSAFPPKYVKLGLSALYAIIILSVTLAVANISARLIAGAFQKKGANVPITGLSRAVIRAVIFAIGFLMILNSLGISITPILTALGVGGLAVALALQDTLSNVFAGVHILLEQPVRVGDFIRLHTGEEGFVSDIGWRTTRIRQITNNIVIVPNNKLSQSTITNYHLPETKTVLPIKVNVGYSSDIEKVEKALTDEAGRCAEGIKGLLNEPPPTIRLTNFGESSLEFTVAFHIEEYAVQFEAQHEIRKRLFKRMREEHIEIPYPTRTVEIRQR